ncbi:MAG: prepilin-type N-terminal cleavage/methylation domain-containing protein [Sulfuritalea sp.]|nr:prepilin-type N-terminal cleavage/methylation domain-containing protein [Sulfuritalea sp.]
MIRRRRVARGFSLLELVVVVAVIAVLAAVLLDRLIALEREAERTEVALTLRNLQTGMQLAVGAQIVRGREAELHALLEKNPIEFLGIPVGAGGTARWSYDPGQRVLAYVPRQPAAFGGQTQLRWRYVGRQDAHGRVVGLRIEALD